MMRAMKVWGVKGSGFRVFMLADLRAAKLFGGVFFFAWCVREKDYYLT